MNGDTGGSGTGLVGHEMVHTPLTQQTIHSLKGVEDSTQAGITGHFEVVGQVILCDITVLVSVNDCKSPQLLLYFSKIHPMRQFGGGREGGEREGGTGKKNNSLYFKLYWPPECKFSGPY